MIYVNLKDDLHLLLSTNDLNRLLIAHPDGMILCFKVSSEVF